MSGVTDCKPYFRYCTTVVGLWIGIWNGTMWLYLKKISNDYRQNQIVIQFYTKSTGYLYRVIYSNSGCIERMVQVLLYDLCLHITILSALWFRL